MSTNALDVTAKKKFDESTTLVTPSPLLVTAATASKKELEASTASQSEIKFYDEDNKEIQAGVKSAAEYYVRCVKKALTYPDDITCLFTFTADLGKHPGTRNLTQGFYAKLLTLHGTKLREAIAGFVVPGIARFEFVGETSTDPNFRSLRR